MTLARSGLATAIPRRQEIRPIRRSERRPAISLCRILPSLPAYPSGHAGFGGALFEIPRKYYRTNRIRFTFISDEFNGVTRDNNGIVRPVVKRTFASLSEAEEENGQSRIYLGIHWAFDKTEGITQGRRVADYVFTHVLLPGQRR